MKYVGVPQHGPLSHYTNHENPPIAKFYIPRVLPLDDVQGYRSLDFMLSGLERCVPIVKYDR